MCCSITENEQFIIIIITCAKKNSKLPEISGGFFSDEVVYFQFSKTQRERRNVWINRGIRNLHVDCTFRVNNVGASDEWNPVLPCTICNSMVTCNIIFAIALVKRTTSQNVTHKEQVNKTSEDNNRRFSSLEMGPF